MASLSNEVPVPAPAGVSAASAAKTVSGLVSKPLVAAAAAAAVHGASQIVDDGGDGERCTLLPGIFGLSIQLFLCIISIAVVFIKYRMETPRRSLPAFLMDFITLMCGSGTVHVVNILSSIMIQRLHEGSDAVGDECNLYFMTTLFDATIGIFLEYKIVRYLAIRKEAHHYLQRTRKSVFTPTTEELADATRIATAALSSGSPLGMNETDLEGHLPDRDEGDHVFESLEFSMEGGWRRRFWRHLVRLVTSPNQWARDMGNEKFVENLLSWMAIVCSLKVFSIAVFAIFSGSINSIGDFILGFFEKRHTLKLLFVMVGAPLVLNVFQYCVTDTIIKLKTVGRSHRTTKI
ncbi:related to Vacuolar membrane protein [Babesia ovata]|uniref:Related to Vacuolar membrane protein n=1 Tax=Babesia ovata TaxID=189622 RepID=A0A2H6KGV5_9APIC|nr:related to Vacuolar membrane protein [Babesia ovata]GBE62228.1 related to Vacuolar membrane protein [Babesia ovata]